MNEELELYKLLCTSDNKLNYPAANEIRWEKEGCLCWINYIFIFDFIDEIKRIFGRGIFDDGGVETQLLSGDICFDLCKAFGHCADIEAVFPKVE